MARKQKLELTWIGKDKRERLEPRVLVEEPSMGHAAPAPDGSAGVTDNLLIKGDNLLALKALEAEFTGQVKCIYIDPPFNTGAAFEHYNDGLEHSIWLRLMRQRIEILWRLLREDGVFWIHIDDKEMAYLKVICDEICGRRNFMNMMVVKTSDPSGHKTVNPSPYSQTEYVLMYVRNREQYKYEQRYVEAEYDPGYNQFILNRDDHFSKWKTTGLNDHVAQSLGYESTREANRERGRRAFASDIAAFALEHADAVFQPVAISNAAGRAIIDLREASKDTPGTVLHLPREGYEDIYALNGRQVYFYSLKLRDIEGVRAPSKPLTNLWTDIPYNGIAREGGVQFKNGKKPERLLWRCIELSTNTGDLVLDSFAGSGTTGAVAHKMGRRWIMVELGDHADTHIVPRLNKVIDGDDPGGVTEATGWQGGGSYRYFRLAPSLLQKDRWGQYVISPDFKPEMLAEAVCKLMGFTYAPSQDRFWQHGASTETDFIYVTTQRLTRDALRKLSEEVGPTRTLLVCCRAHEANTFDNLTVRKIPQAVLSKAEWGRDDYSLNIQDAPPEPITEADMTDGDDGDDDTGTVEAAE